MWISKNTKTSRPNGISFHRWQCALCCSPAWRPSLWYPRTLLPMNRCDHSFERTHVWTWLSSIRSSTLSAAGQGTELDDLYAEFNSASQEIITQLHGTSEYYSADTVPVQKLAQTVDPWHPDHQGSEDKNTKAARDATEELAEEDDDTPYTQMLLDEYPTRTREPTRTKPSSARTRSSVSCFHEQLRWQSFFISSRGAGRHIRRP